MITAAFVITVLTTYIIPSTLSGASFRMIVIVAARSIIGMTKIIIVPMAVALGHCDS